MFNSKIPSKQKINVDSYRDKVLGCWTGKNIGGTIGAPFEGKREVLDVNFYTQDLDGKPEPNDDLDLQLIWLLAAEDKGIYHLDERVLGEYWLSHITGPWNEYGVCKANIRNGMYPPLSGSCNNDKWKYSNGAWIRSEIWACIFPGSPDEAAQFAYYDACCDHCGEGIYAELFTAAIESAAFVIDDVHALINIALTKIPDDCRIARSVKLTCDYYDKGMDWLSARQALVKDSEDLGWFQAPANIGFMIVGLLYGEGDFGKSVCIATNCGDDTDCTAGTVGALLGIILGRSGIPEKWTDPIGESIRTCSIDTYERNNVCPIPKSLNELTSRVLNLAKLAQLQNQSLPQFSEGETDITQEYFETFTSCDDVKKRIWDQSPYEMAFDLPYGRLSIDYDQGPEIVCGEEKSITIRLSNVRFIEKVVSISFILPDGWQVLPCKEVVFTATSGNVAEVSLSITPDHIDGAVCYLPVVLRLCDRFSPTTVHVPFQNKGSVLYNLTKKDHRYYDQYDRCRSRLGS